MIKIISLFVAVLFLLGGCGTAKNDKTNAPQSDPKETGDTLQDPIIQRMPSGPNPDDEKTKTFTLEDVSRHNTREDCWTVIDGTVADITSFFGKHPGGDDKLALSCGKDASKIFASVKKHDPDGYAKLESLSIGKLTQQE